MTALTVLSDITTELGLTVSELRIGSDDLLVRQIVRHMNATGAEVARRAEWSKMTKVAILPNSVSEWQLPSDFFRLVERGAVWIPGTDGSLNRPVRLVLSTSTWAFLSERPSAQRYCHLSEGSLKFSPALDGDGARVKYISSNWIEGSNRITQDGDVLDVPEELIKQGAIWRWRRQKGQDHQDLVSEYEATILSEIKADRGAT